jgi:hypothetical protein
MDNDAAPWARLLLPSIAEPDDLAAVAEPVQRPRCSAVRALSIP